MMKPFSLQTVLNHRKRLEDIAQHRYLEAKKTLSIIETKLDDASHALTLFIAESAQLQQEGIGITELIRHEERIAAQRQNIQAIKKNLAEKKQLVEKEQQNLLLRSKEHQILERLKETQNKAWHAYLNKQEAAMLDEIATTRHEPDLF
ncbi:flagellar export protein FliJ [Desulfopila sp. IMCC35006]|uniref:flagellar export protein FliJ n=1 Tax=Desulfopila sp. IMCC35006 TaxID=2569542 RepID=UPI0010AD73CC|nr:flagellar export protein FliJ [Desulfopila sp. IMCC35006]TKB25795.1 flagellar export protein FliJ [Desulfopila sp. IMCC35006]